MKELQRIIKETTGEDVALRYRKIYSTASAPMGCSIPQTKAIHMEVDNALSDTKCQNIASMYASHVQFFPLAIKMHFVLEVTEVHNNHTRTKVLALQARQARFLTRTKTSRICTPPNSNLKTS